MHVITRQRLQAFWQTHPDAERPLKAWLAMVRLKRYGSPASVREDFASASFLGKWRTVFINSKRKFLIKTTTTMTMRELPFGVRSW